MPLTKKTSYCPLPYKGAPLDVHDMIMAQVRKEEKFLLMPEPATELPPPEKRLPLIKHTVTSAYVFSQNIYRFSQSLLQP